MNNKNTEKHRTCGMYGEPIPYTKEALLDCVYWTPFYTWIQLKKAKPVTNHPTDDIYNDGVIAIRKCDQREWEMKMLGLPKSCFKLYSWTRLGVIKHSKNYKYPRRRIETEDTITLNAIDWEALGERYDAIFFVHDTPYDYKRTKSILVVFNPKCIRYLTKDQRKYYAKKDNWAWIDYADEVRIPAEEE